MWEAFSATVFVLEGFTFLKKQFSFACVLMQVNA